MKPKEFYVMVESGLMEMEGRTTYNIRTDRPWSDKELWGFEQKVLIEKQAFNEAMKLIEKIGFIFEERSNMVISNPIEDFNADAFTLSCIRKAIKQWRERG